MATYEDLIKQGYQGSATVKKYQTQLDNALGAKPADYSSAYTKQLNDLYGQITNMKRPAEMDSLYSQINNRKPFSYDINGDALYQQYRTQYQNMGQRAMRDTMGQAAALTGGYGNTYAQNVGQQAYNQYLTQLNDKIPELYQLARSNYDADTNDLYRRYQLAGDRYESDKNDLYQRYSLTKDRDDTDYGRWQDRLNSWQSDVELYNSLFQNERNFDYNLWNDNIAYLMKLAEMANAGGGGGGGRSRGSSSDVGKVTAPASTAGIKAGVSAALAAAIPPNQQVNEYNSNGKKITVRQDDINTGSYRIAKKH